MDVPFIRFITKGDCRRHVAPVIVSFVHLKVDRESNILNRSDGSDMCVSELVQADMDALG